MNADYSPPSGLRSSGLQLPAPAKINRFLRVTGRRADGYHQLETLFQFLEFADIMRFEVSQQPRIRRIDRHDFELPEQDLSVRAARLLQTTIPAAATRGATITLQKKIPPGSGLGGGSSNAATTLLALNHLWRLGVPRTRLAELGLQLGADVPVFVHGRAALATGIGEILEPFDPPEQWLCVCLPPVHVSTARVFSHLPLKPATEPATESATESAAESVAEPVAGNADKIDDTLGNDLEPVAAKLYPEVALALAHLRRYADARLSGSGAAVYASFDSREQAEHAVAQLPDDLPAFVTHSRNRHPLVHEW